MSVSRAPRNRPRRRGEERRRPPSGGARTLNGKGRGVVAAVALALLALAVTPFLLPDRAEAAPTTLGLDVRVFSDGAPSFDGDDLAGNDSSANNLLVRSYDEVTYAIDASANDVDATQVVFSSTLVDGMNWKAIPGGCLTSGATPPSSISPDRRTLTCNFGDLTEGSNVSIQATATVGAFVNGELLPMSGSLTSGATSLTDSAEDITVSAAPKVDIGKSFPQALPGYWGKNDQGQDGYYFFFPISVVVGGTGKGSEPLNGADLSFVDDFSQVAPSATYVDWDTTGLTVQRNICGPMDAGVMGVPFGEIGIKPEATNINSVEDSGTWTCTPGPGQTIDITVSGYATDGTAPSRDSAGISLNRSFIVSGQVALWASVTDLPNNAGSTGVNRVSWSVEPVGVGGGANVGEDPTTDTRKAEYQRSTPGGNTIHYTDENAMGFDTGTLIQTTPPWTSQSMGGPAPLGGATSAADWLPPGQGAAGTGTGVVSRGDQLTLQQSIPLPGGGNFAGCIQLSPGQSIRPVDTLAFQQLTPDYTLDDWLLDKPTPIVEYTTATAPSILHGLGTPLAYSGTQGPPGYGMNARTAIAAGSTWDAQIYVEYSTDEPTSYNGGCESNYVWSDQIPVDPSMVRQVRYRTTNPVAAGQDATLGINLGIEVTTGTDFIYATKGYAYWQGDPFTDFPEDGFSKMPVSEAANCYPAMPQMPWQNDCLRVATNGLMIDKSVTSAKTSGLKVGDIVSYQVVVTATGDPDTSATAVTLADQIPAGLEFIGTSQQPATSNGATTGASELIWDLGDIAGGTSKTVTYSVRVLGGFSALQTFMNTASATGNTSIGGEAQLLPPISDSATVQAADAYAEAAVSKSTSTPSIDPDGTMEFSITYSNVGPVDLGAVDLIDVLPYKTDSLRSPATSFSGTAVLDSVDAPNGETVYFTNESPSTPINRDPQDPSNQLGAPSIWCLDGGDCNFPMSDATAIRFTKPGPFAAGSSFTIKIMIATSGNNIGDVYTNDFGGRVDGISLPIWSNDVPVYVGPPPTTTTVAPTTTTVAPTTTTVAPTTTTVDPTTTTVAPTTTTTVAPTTTTVAPTTTTVAPTTTTG
jgi:uncharacterized repeat protein (TIGR01451 family)